MRRGFETLAAILLLAAATGCGAGAEAKKKPGLSSVDLTPGEQVRMAQSLVRAGKTHEALEQLSKAIAAHPDEASLHYHYGQYAFLAGRYEEAEGALRRALDLEPYLTDAHNYLGAVYDKLDRPAEAEREYRKALADPAYVTPELVYLNLGLLYRSQGRDSEAIDSIRKAVGIDPQFFKGHFELAMTLSKVGRLEESAREFEVARPGYRDDGDYHYQMGLTYFRLGRKAQARESLRRVIDVAPGSPSAAKADELLKVLD